MKGKEHSRRRTYLQVFPPHEEAQGGLGPNCEGHPCQEHQLHCAQALAAGKAKCSARVCTLQGSKARRKRRTLPRAIRPLSKKNIMPRNEKTKPRPVRTTPISAHAERLASQNLNICVGAKQSAHKSKALLSQTERCPHFFDRPTCWAISWLPAKLGTVRCVTAASALYKLSMAGGPVQHHFADAVCTRGAPTSLEPQLL